MFEKEAKEYRKDLKSKFFLSEPQLDLACQGFKDGYNKAKEEECKLLKSLLYCTVKSCNNCGKVNCENFQRQRIDYCSLWVSYKDYIAKLEKENSVLKKKNSDEEIEEMQSEFEKLEKWEVKEK